MVDMIFNVIIILLLMCVICRVAKFDIPFKNKKSITYYYKPNCPYCVEFMPMWNEFASRVDNIETIAVNCNESPKKCEGIRSVPHIVFRNNYRKMIFNGERTLDNLISFAHN